MLYVGESPKSLKGGIKDRKRETQYFSAGVKGHRPDFPIDQGASKLGKGSVRDGKVLGLFTPGTHRLFPPYSGLSSDTLGKTKLRNAPDQTRNCTPASHASRDGLGDHLLGNCPLSLRALPPRRLPGEAPPNVVCGIPHLSPDCKISRVRSKGENRAPGNGLTSKSDQD